MAVFRVNKTADYTVISNFHLKDRRMSLKAKGLLSLILSLPDEWNYTIDGLVAICVERETAVKAALNELKKCGYLRIDKIKPCKNNGGRYEYVYNIFEQPTEIQGVEIQGVENLPLYKDTNISSMDISDKPTRPRFIKPTLEEVQAYCNERQNNIDAQRFIDYYSSNGWKVGKNPMKDWKAAVRTWERNGYEASKPEQTPKQGSGNFFIDMMIEEGYGDG